MRILKKLLTIQLLLSASQLHSVAAPPQAEDSPSPRPNIILFLVDDMGLMDTSVPFLTDSDGQPKKFPLNNWYRTPNMEALAKNGIRFSNFYAQSVCSPTRASIMTGQNATRHHTTQFISPQRNNRGNFGPPNWNWKGLTKDSITLPRLLQKNGYTTIHIGKGHFGPKQSEGAEPLNLGFDVNIAGAAIGRPGTYLKSYGKGGTHAVPHLEKYHNTGTFLTEALTREANQQITEATKAENPFFLYMSHYAVHGPFNADPRFIGNYRGKSKRAHGFAALVEGMDKSLGDIIQHLENLKVADDTLILFLGDNGSDAPLGKKTAHASSAPLRGKKGTMFEGGTRVPFIAAWAHPNPSSKLQKSWPIVQGSINTADIGTVMDIYATILDVSHTTNPKNHPIDATSLKPLLIGKKDPDREQAFLMHYPHNHNSFYFTSLRLGDWKLIYQYFDQEKFHLYNLKNDPYENNNLATQNPEKVKQLFTEMQKRLKSQNAQYPVKNDQPIKPSL